MEFLLRLYIILQAETMFPPSCAYPHEAIPNHAIHRAHLSQRAPAECSLGKPLYRNSLPFHLRRFCCLDTLLSTKGLKVSSRRPVSWDQRCSRNHFCSILLSLLHRAAFAWQMCFTLSCWETVSKIMTHRQRIKVQLEFFLTWHRLTYISLIYRYLWFAS